MKQLKDLKLTNQERLSLEKKSVGNSIKGGLPRLCYACGFGDTPKLEFAIDMRRELRCIDI